MYIICNDKVRSINISISWNLFHILSKELLNSSFTVLIKCKMNYCELWPLYRVVKHKKLSFLCNYIIVLIIQPTVSPNLQTFFHLSVIASKFSLFNNEMLPLGFHIFPWLCWKAILPYPVFWGYNERMLYFIKHFL